MELKILFTLVSRIFNMRISIIILSIFCAVNTFAQTYIDYYHFIKSSEGYRSIPYKDTKGNWTVGIGHLIGKNGHIKKSQYTHTEIIELFNKDLDIAQKDARKLFKSFDRQPKNIKLVLVSLSFNLGYNRLSKFIRFRAAIDKGDYKTAAKELKDSLWYKQVGLRGVKYYNIVKNHE